MEFKTAAGYIRRGKPSDQWLLDESKDDRWLGDITDTVRHIHELYVFVAAGEPVGFVIPLKDPDGYWRTGSVYITPAKRTFGSIKKLTGDFFSHKKSLNFGVDSTPQVA